MKNKKYLEFTQDLKTEFIKTIDPNEKLHKRDHDFVIYFIEEFTNLNYRKRVFLYFFNFVEDFNKKRKNIKIEETLKEIKEKLLLSQLNINQIEQFNELSLNIFFKKENISFVCKNFFHIYQDIKKILKTHNIKEEEKIFFLETLKYLYEIKMDFKLFSDHELKEMEKCSDLKISEKEDIDLTPTIKYYLTKTNKCLVLDLVKDYKNLKKSFLSNFKMLDSAFIEKMEKQEIKKIEAKIQKLRIFLISDDFFSVDDIKNLFEERILLERIHSLRSINRIIKKKKEKNKVIVIEDLEDLIKSGLIDIKEDWSIKEKIEVEKLNQRLLTREEELKNDVFLKRVNK